MVRPLSQRQFIKAAQALAAGKGLLACVAALGLASCDKSPLGPTIAGRDYPTSTAVKSSVVTSVGSKTVSSAGSGSYGGGSSASSGSASSSSSSSDTSTSTSTSSSTAATPTAVTCTASPSRGVFYGGSTVTQAFSCSDTVTSVSTTSMPSFLTSSFSGKTVSFTGTAPSAASQTTWSFTANGGTSVAANVSTTILASSSLASSLSPPSAFDATNGAGTSNNVVFDLGHKITLDSSWDGAMSNAALSTTAISSDMHGLSYYSACASATVPYVCNGTASSSGFTVNNGLNLRWRWSAFDQGSYYLDINPRTTIESGVNDLSAVTFNATIPLQTTGNVTITPINDPDSGNTYDDQLYRYGLAVSSQSTAMAPVAAVLYTDSQTTNRSFFKRLTVDRSVAPGGSLVGQGATALAQNTANSQDFSVASLSDGSWAVVGGILTTGSYDVIYNHVADSATAPSTSYSLQLTSYSGTTDRALYIDASRPFSDGGTTRMGVAYVRRDTGTGQNAVVIAKINPAGTSSGTVLDDLNYGVANGGGYSKFELAATTNNIDRLHLRQAAESGTGYFYLVYRNATNLMILKLLSSNRGASPSPTTFAAGVFADAGTGANKQSIDLAMGTKSGSTIAGVVYRDSNGDCYFQRATFSLTVSTAIKLNTSTSNQCYFPTVQFNATTGRFVVVYAEKNGSNKFDLKTSDITLGTTDSASTPVIVTQNLNNYPIKMVSDFYAGGSWMALFYRVLSDSNLKFHGFHASGR